MSTDVGDGGAGAEWAPPFPPRLVEELRQACRTIPVNDRKEQAP